MHFRYLKDTGLTLDKALSTEWLETNGLGGYASSTILNCHTRKYHGLLVSRLEGLNDKYVLFNKVDDLVINNNERYCLTAHRYPEFFQDGCFTNLQEFAVTTHPLWNFKFSSFSLTKEILMPQGENTVLFKYRIKGGGRYQIGFRPLLALRNFHSLQHENAIVAREVDRLTDGFSCTPYPGLPKLFFQTNAKFSFLSEPLWYRNFVYPKEQERGYEFMEDLFSPGILLLELAGDEEVTCSCGTSWQKNSLAIKWQQEVERRGDGGGSSDRLRDFQEQLRKTGQSFITASVTEKKVPTITAGYPWFLEWGRDAMISLPGLTFYSDQVEVGLAILKTFALHESRGLIPNFLGATPETDAYNAVDASLWFGWAVQQYYLKTKNQRAVATYFWQTLKSIFKHYLEGTLYNIKMQTNGLLLVDNSEVNLTWMDAMVDGKPVTPRSGYQVEVNALWFNFLSFMAELARELKDEISNQLQQLVPLAQFSFRQTFWCEEKGYLYDFVNPQEKNSLLRPNQIFAVSLPYSPLLIQMAVGVVTAVREHLLTPYGLRTLARYETGYIGCYGGNQRERDRAYHNGTVWPWLLGPFAEALLKVTSDRRKVLATLNPCLEALQNHLAEYGIGSIAEIFSGDSPHRPDGCISQAWSVAEVLRLTYLLDLK